MNEHFAVSVWFPPGNSRLFLLRARAYDALGREAAVMADYYAFLLWDPDHPEAGYAEARLAEHGIVVPRR